MVDPELELQWFYSIISLQSTYSVWKYELFPKGHKVGEKNHKRGGTEKRNRKKVGKPDNTSKSNCRKY